MNAGLFTCLSMLSPEEEKFLLYVESRAVRCRWVAFFVYLFCQSFRTYLLHDIAYTSSLLTLSIFLLSLLPVNRRTIIISYL